MDEVSLSLVKFIVAERVPLTQGHCQLLYYQGNAGTCGTRQLNHAQLSEHRTGQCWLFHNNWVRIMDSMKKLQSYEKYSREEIGTDVC